MNSIEYRIQSGETLSTIARRHNVTEEELSRLNPISVVGSLVAGQVLRIPKGSQLTWRASPKPQEYRVRANDTLTKIARRFKITVEALAQANEIDPKDKIKIGQVLTIPPASESDKAGDDQASKKTEVTSTPIQKGMNKQQATASEDSTKTQDPKKQVQKKGNAPVSQIPGWEDSTDSVLVLINDTERAYVIPGSGLTIVPSKGTLTKARQASAYFPQDQGMLFEVPAVGAGGSRIFRAGPRGALMLDAGSNPREAVPAAVYVDQLQSVMANLGLTRLDKLQIIHVHKDHISSIPDVVQQYGLTPDKLSIPKQFLQHGPMRRVIDELRTRPATRALGYTEAWVPGTVLKDRSGGQGDIFRYSYKVGELTVENVGLRSAFRNVARHPDRASYLTRVTRPADQFSTVILGDLRGFDLGLIRTSMETQRPGSWSEFFRGVTTLSGFSHHVGSMTSEHIPGMMSLLDETLLRTGRLRVVEQTHPGDRSLGQGRLETMDLMSRLGIELVTAEQPTEGSTPSGAGASKERLTSRGPQARARPITTSPLTEGVARIQRLVEARTTIEVWRPLFEEADPGAKRYLDKELLPQLEQSLQQLRAATRNAIQAAFRVRTEGERARGGVARDYGATGGQHGAAYVAALRDIPRTTGAETTLGPTGFAALARYREMDAKDVPLRVALNAALLKGEYSEKAFAHMLSALDPATRKSLLTGRRGGLSTKAFERVRVQYAFQTSVLSTGDISIPHHWSPGARAATRGGAGFFAILEIWNSVVVPTMEGIKTQKHVFKGRNLLPFLRRLLFWQQIGIIPKLVGVDDGVLSVTEERNASKVTTGLNTELWDALYFEEPGISDADVLKFGNWIALSIRNLDEFFVFFMDSFQDAISWEGGDGDWKKAKWQIRVGRYKLSGENHVEEYWYTHDKLTQLMQVYTARLIANTQELLDEHGRLGKISQETHERLGALNELNLALVPLYRAQLKTGRTTVPEQPTPIQLYSVGHQMTLEKQEVKWTYPPQFYVYKQQGEHLLVGGADFNTYATLRRLIVDARQLNMGGDGRTFVTTQKVRNTSGQVLIHQSLLEKLQ